MRGTVVVSRRPNQTDKPRTALKEEKKKEKGEKNAAVNSCYEFPSSKHNHTHMENARVKGFKALQSSKT